MDDKKKKTTTKTTTKKTTAKSSTKQPKDYDVCPVTGKKLCPETGRPLDELKVETCEGTKESECATKCDGLMTEEVASPSPERTLQPEEDTNEKACPTTGENMCDMKKKKPSLLCRLFGRCK